MSNFVKQQVTLKHRRLCTRLYGATSQNTVPYIQDPVKSRLVLLRWGTTTCNHSHKNCVSLLCCQTNLYIGMNPNCVWNYSFDIFVGHLTPNTFICVKVQICVAQRGGILSQKCVVRRFRRCANVIQCTYTNLDSIAYYLPRLYGIAYCF